MKNNSMNRLLIPTLSAVLTFLLLCTGLPAVAQQTDGSDSIPRHRKAWEIGVGIHGMQLTRFNVTGFSPGSNGGYRIDTDKRDVLFGGHLYLARELNSHFFLDLQGNADFTADPVRGGKEKRWTAMAGMGLQWRLGEYFRSPYIDPFLRAGANYLYKNFTVGYNGLERLNAEEMKWDLANDFDKEGSDRRHLLPLSVGAGVNLWLNDRLGLGLQADYLVMPYRRVSNAWQGNVRLLWRIGGKTKRPAPEVRYVDRIVEKVIEKPVLAGTHTVEQKVIERPATAQAVAAETVKEATVHKDLPELFAGIEFDFDSSAITAESAAILDQIAQVMLADTSRHYLLTGCTDARGSQTYNLALSKRRAQAVMNYLIEHGVPSQMLKGCGVGSKLAHIAPDMPDQVRRGDRKIMVEMITNPSYWDHLTMDN